MIYIIMSVTRIFLSLFLLIFLIIDNRLNQEENHLNDNITFKLVKKEVQKKIINYLYQSGEISISEYEALLSKCDEKIYKLKDGLEKEQDKYIHAIKVDIKI